VYVHISIITLANKKANIYNICDPSDLL